MNPVIRFLIIPTLAGLAAGFVAAKLNLNATIIFLLVNTTAILAALITSRLNPLTFHFHNETTLRLLQELYIFLSPQFLGEAPVKRRSFRRQAGSRTWHFCLNCSTWPDEDYEAHEGFPEGEICNECNARWREGNCQSAAQKHKVA